MVSLKRSSAEDTSRAPQRIKPTAINMTPLRVLNVQSRDTIHQQCLLFRGECPSFDNSSEDYVVVKTTDSMKVAESSHNWPVHAGGWKALVLLAPGDNTVTVSLHHAGGMQTSIALQLVYQPLLQVPPLHLAIMVAKDSPLVIDCPPAKYGAISSAHNSLDAVIAKFRMSAYMWQALTGEDMRDKELGRRSFRFEEEWVPDTSSFPASKTNAEGAIIMKSLPKVHIIRTDKTVAELRDSMLAQQNSQARRRDELHEIFTKALKAHGGPFDSNCRPVVAGLILDSQYSIDQDLILGHAALGCHQRSGLSLGMFGSHLTYSWPRSMEEVASCLLDQTPPGDTVGNDNGECSSMARACFIGQGAFLHEVGHAFGADHTWGIMRRGYSKGWGREFICHESLNEYKSSDKEDHHAKWAIQDALRFSTMPHFRVPGDEPMSRDFIHGEIHATGDIDEDGEEVLHVTCTAGLVRLELGNGTHTLKSHISPASNSMHDFRTSELTQFDKSEPLELAVLARNGKERTFKNAWRLFKEKTFIQVPGTGVRLQKTSVKSSSLEEEDDATDSYLAWTTLLSKLSSDGKIVPCSGIDLRVGCTLDGAVVYYSDGTYAHCGPTHRGGHEHHFGGHASERKDFGNKNVEIVKVEVNKAGSWSQGSLDGIRMTLANGEQWGYINGDYGGEDDIHTFEPEAGEKIIGFFGKSLSFMEEFGIITGPKEFVLPKEAYAIPELKNNLVQNSTPSKRRLSEEFIENSDDEDEQMDSQETI